MIPLEDLASHQLVFNPTTKIWYPKVRSKKKGISDRYTHQAEADATNFINFEHPYGQIKEIINSLDLGQSEIRILDIASGFGNTVLPLLRDFPSAQVVATDLSDAMLIVLSRFASEMGVEDRLTLLEIDAIDIDILAPESFDLIIGGAALHHFVKPDIVISRCLQTLKMGGYALFFEPMELGLSLFALSLEFALPVIENMNTPLSNLAVIFYRNIIKDILYRARRFTDEYSPAWEDLDDKWVFARSYLEEIALQNESTLILTPLHSLENPFLSHAQTILSLYGGIDPTEIFSEEVKKAFKRFEMRFSSFALAESPLEASVIFKKLT